MIDVGSTDVAAAGDEQRRKKQGDIHPSLLIGLRHKCVRSKHLQIRTAETGSEADVM